MDARLFPTLFFFFWNLQHVLMLHAKIQATAELTCLLIHPQTLWKWPQSDPCRWWQRPNVLSLGSVWVTRHLASQPRKLRRRSRHDSDGDLQPLDLAELDLLWCQNVKAKDCESEAGRGPLWWPSPMWLCDEVIYGQIRSRNHDWHFNTRAIWTSC